MSRSTINKDYLVGDEVIVKVGGKVMAGKLTEVAGSGTFMFAKEPATDMFIVSIDQILNKIDTLDSIRVKFPKGAECIIQEMVSDSGEEYLVNITRITGKAV